MADYVLEDEHLAEQADNEEGPKNYALLAEAKHFEEDEYYD